MNKIRICSCGREKVYLSAGIRKDIYCSICGNEIEYVDPPIVSVCISTEKTSDSYEYVSLKRFGNALMETLYDNMADEDKEAFNVLFKGLIKGASPMSRGKYNG